MDPVSLAATVVANFLAPYAQLGLKKAGEVIAKHVGEVGAARVTDVADRVWQKVAGLFRSDKDRAALELFTEDPDTMSEKLKKMLVEKLREHPGEALELESVINGDKSLGTSSGAHILHAAVAAVIDLRGATISGSRNTFVGVQTARPDILPSDDSEEGPKSVPGD